MLDIVVLRKSPRSKKPNTIEERPKKSQ